MHLPGSAFFTSMIWIDESGAVAHLVLVAPQTLDAADLLWLVVVHAWRRITVDHDDCIRHFDVVAS